MKKTFLITAWLCFLCLLPHQKGMAQEAKYKALFLYQFTKYIKWEAKDKIIIGVLGNSKVLLELQGISKRGGGSKFEILKIAGEEAMKKCDMIFLPESQTRNFNLIQQAVAGKSVVVVTENKELAEKGAEISFYLDNGKLKFILNESEINKTGVKVSAALLGIAKII